MSNGPLAGVRVFDLTMWMVGPWCSVQLGALGADVIHIEQPDVEWGSLGAGVPPLIHGTSIGYIAWNMNKRGLSLGMKSPEDRAVAYELLRTSDVFLINMTPGVADRLGVGYGRGLRDQPQHRLLRDHRLGRERTDAVDARRGYPRPVRHRLRDRHRNPRRRRRTLPPLHPDGRDQRQLRRPGDPDGPRGPQAHRQGTARPRLDAEGGLGAAERPASASTSPAATSRSGSAPLRRTPRRTAPTSARTARPSASP